MKTVKYYMEKIRDASVHLIELVVVFFTPAIGQIFLVGLAIFADTLTGTWASVKTGERFNSKRLSDFIPKTIVYITLLLLAHGIEVIFDQNHVRTIVAIALVALELVSIDENFKKATGKGIFKPIIGLLKK